MQLFKLVLLVAVPLAAARQLINEYDVVVYESTPGGIMTAIAGAACSFRTIASDNNNKSASLISLQLRDAASRLRCLPALTTLAVFALGA